MKSALLVLGMHRSGTSATTGVLHHLGFCLGKHLLDPAPDNRKGFWENAVVVRLDEQLLKSIDRTWDDPRGVSNNEGLREEASTQDNLREALRAEFDDSPRIAIKDPRMCLVSGCWIRALREEGYRIHTLLVRRHPDAVVQSLDRRDVIHPLIGYALYCRYTLAAVRGVMQAEASVMLDYEAFLKNWRSTLDPVLRGLGVLDISFDDDLVARIDSFVDTDMSHATRDYELADDPDTKVMRKFAIRVYKFVAATSNWSEDGVDKLEREFSKAVDGFSEAGQARFDTHLRWCRRHEKETSRLRDLFDANLDQLRRTDQSLVDANALALSRLDSLERVSASKQVLGEQVTELHAALEQAQQLSLTRLEQLEMRESRLGQLESEIEHLTEQSLQRLQLAEERDKEARRLTEALNSVTDLSVRRLDEIHRQESKLKEYDQALSKVTELSLERLAQIVDLNDALDEARSQGSDVKHTLAESSEQRVQLEQERDEEARRLTEALDSVNEISVRRLDEIHRQESLLKEYDQALNKVTELSLERLEKLEMQESRLGLLEGEIEHLTEQSRQRLQLVEERDEEARKLTEALGSVTELSVRRLDEIHRQESQLKEYDQALNRVTELSLDRLAQVEGLNDALDAACNQIRELKRTLSAERELHARTKRHAHRLRKRALHFASEALTKRNSWLGCLK